MLSPTEIKQILSELGVEAKVVVDMEHESEIRSQSLLDVVMDRQIVEKAMLGQKIAEKYSVPYEDVSRKVIVEKTFFTLPERISRKFKVVIFSRDESAVHMAMSDPTNTDIVTLLHKKTGLEVKSYFAFVVDIEECLHRFKRDLQHSVDIMLRPSLAKSASDDAPIAKIVDLIFDTAYEEKASDIHFEPQEKYAIVRFRIDGALVHGLSISRQVHERMVTRVKVLSNLRTDEHLGAQDGKMKVILDGERVDIRVSIVPISEGEKIVMRLLSSSNQNLTLEDLGMQRKDLERVKLAYSRSFGMILSTGPTGSGKTTSIYSILKILNTPDKNITTVEDPVEYKINGANQIQVNAKSNLTFANGLRSILRQDPNIIFVGEIRDSETAGIAVNAALTGHLVLSTLHTNDAATALPRLIDMKVEPFLVATTVNVIIGQQLIRKICQACRIDSPLPRLELEKELSADVVNKHFGTEKTIHLFAGKGCKVCRNSGYKGRVGLYEVLDVSPEIRELIVAKADSNEIVKKAIEQGMTLMLDDGLAKVRMGLTTLSEVLRVTKTES